MEGVQISEEDSLLSSRSSILLHGANRL